jgi:multiple sugar transport system substrate-binding protein
MTKGDKQQNETRWNLAGMVPVAALLGALMVPSLANAWSYKEAAEPYKGVKIDILDEVTPLQQGFAKLVPEFVAETGIEVNYQLLNHFEVINKGQADLLSGRGAYDGVMVHSAQTGLIFGADVFRPIDDFMADSKLTSPDIDTGDFIEPAWSTTAKFNGKTYSLPAWNYNVIYWARGDLISHPDEKANFKAKYGYDLAPAETMQQMRDIAEFFTRKSGEKLAGKTLESDFYGIAVEGIKGGTTWGTVWNSFIKNWGGDIFDKDGRPNFDTANNRAAVKYWGDLWKFGPPGLAEASLLDVPTLMGSGVVAQAIAWSDFALGVDQPGKSAFAGKFAYRPIPRNADYDGPRSAEGAPSVIGISKASKNPEATYLFIQWMADKQTQAKFAEAIGGGVAVRKSSWGLPTFKNSRFAPLYAAMEETLLHVEGKPRVPKIYEIFDALSGLMQEVGLGKITPAEATKRGQEAMVKICDDKCTL